MISMDKVKEVLENTRSINTSIRKQDIGSHQLLPLKDSNSTVPIDTEEMGGLEVWKKWYTEQVSRISRGEEKDSLNL